MLHALGNRPFRRGFPNVLISQKVYVFFPHNHVQRVGLALAVLPQHPGSRLLADSKRDQVDQWLPPSPEACPPASLTSSSQCSYMAQGQSAQIFHLKTHPAPDSSALRAANLLCSCKMGNRTTPLGIGNLQLPAFAFLRVCTYQSARNRLCLAHMPRTCHDMEVSAPAPQGPAPPTQSPAKACRVTCYRYAKDMDHTQGHAADTC